MDYQHKYLKYKIKYLNFKKIYQDGGFRNIIEELHDIIDRLPKEANCCYQDITKIYDNLSVGSPIADYMFIVKKTMEEYLNNLNNLRKKLPEKVPEINDIGRIYLRYYREIIDDFINATHDVISMLQKYINDKKKLNEVVYIAVYSREGPNREPECVQTTTESCQEIFLTQKLTRMRLVLQEINKKIPDEDPNKEKMRNHMAFIESKLDNYNELRRSIDEDKEIKKYTVKYEDVIQGKFHQEKEIQKQEKEQIKQERKRLQEKEKEEMEQIKREKEKLQGKKRQERIKIKERQRNIDHSIRLRKREEQKHRKEEKNRKKKEEWLKNIEEKKHIKLNKEIEKMEKKLKDINIQEKLLEKKRKKELSDLVIEKTRINRKINQLNQMKENQRAQISVPFNVRSSRKKIGEIYHDNDADLLSDDTYTLSTNNSYTMSSNDTDYSKKFISLTDDNTF